MYLFIISIIIIHLSFSNHIFNSYNDTLISSNIFKNKLSLFYYLNTAYGNEDHQAQLYFDIIDSNKEYKKLEAISFESYFHCFKGNINSAYNCVIDINWLYENITTIASDYANTYSNDSFVKSMDCNYDISLRNVKYMGYPRGSYHFHFTIEENHCKSNISIPSGSSFDVYGISNSYLVSCKQYSRNNSNIYDIICIIPEDSLDTSITERCINATMILKGMHFDNFNELMKSFDRRYFRVLNDNKQYCYASDNLSIISDVIINNTSINDIWYYTGEWVTANSSNFVYSYSSNDNIQSGHVTSYNYHSNLCKTPPKDIFTVTSSSVFGKFPQLSTNISNNYKYKFKHKIFSNIIDNYQINDNISYYKGILLNEKNQYYFVGSSHMRYNFDSISQYLQGDNITSKLGRKHGYTNFLNLFDLSSYQSTKSLFADDQTDYLHSICNNFENSKVNDFDNNINKTIIFQTGAWDIAWMPLTRIFREKVAGMRLLTELSKILSGEIPCGRLTHFVWMTTVPYHTCYHDSDKRCSIVTGAGHRINAAISSLNQFYLKRLMKFKLKEDLRLSIIDAYSIIKARLLFHRYIEVVCDCHFTCRISCTFESPLFIVHTPAGDAVIDSMLLALANN